MRKSTWAVLSVLVVGASALTVPAHAVSIIFCGSHVDRSMTLDRNLLNCSGDGLVVSANGITINLNGYTLGGDGHSGGDGIVSNGHSGLKIKDGEVTKFDSAVSVTGGSGNRVDGLLLTKNRIDGILIDSDRNSVTDNEIAGRQSKIDVFGDGNVVDGNDFTTSPSSTAPIDITVEGDGNRISGNHIKGGSTGIDVAGDDNRIESNRLSGGRHSGIIVLGDDNVVDSNSVQGYRGKGIWLDRSGAIGDSNVVESNITGHNSGDGVLVDSINTVLVRNISKENRGDGFDVNGSHPYLRGNIASKNGFAKTKGYGIIANVTGAQGKSNHARGNARSHQCVPDKLC